MPIAFVPFADYMGDDRMERIAAPIGEEADIAELREYFSYELAKLPPRDREIVKMRFGFDDGYSRTLQEVGDMFGITRERVRQVLGKVIVYFRHPTQKQKLLEFLA